MVYRKIVIWTRPQIIPLGLDNALNLNRHLNCTRQDLGLKINSTADTNNDFTVDSLFLNAFF